MTKRRYHFRCRSSARDKTTTGLLISTGRKWPCPLRALRTSGRTLERGRSQEAANEGQRVVAKLTFGPTTRISISRSATHNRPPSLPAIYCPSRPKCPNIEREARVRSSSDKAVGRTKAPVAGSSRNEERTAPRCAPTKSRSARARIFREGRGAGWVSELKGPPACGTGLR
jgi:hypothetical protein